MNKHPIKLLLVEDDKLLSATLAKVLEENRYEVAPALDGQVGLDLATAIEYDLILLDVQIPKLDGMSLCRQLRSRGYTKPSLLLTAHDSDAEVIAGFDAGADDYISKPCTPEVLLARIKTLLRRSNALNSGGLGQKSSAILTWGNLCLDLDAGRVTFGKKAIALTATEYNLLGLFLRNPDRIFSRSTILDRLWGFDDAPTDRAINTHIKDIRKKLKASGLTEEVIETVYGMGYRLKLPPKSIATDVNTSENRSNSQQPSRIADNSTINNFWNIFNERVALLEQAKNALMIGNLAPELQQSAKSAAHKLAGTMASFGYPQGSKLARSAEHLLMVDCPWKAEEITRFSSLVTGLRQELAKPPMISTATPVPTGISYRVLVIDDDILLTERLKTESTAWGLRMKIAPNLAVARSLLALSTPDVVLLDLSFPETQEDGLTFLQELTEGFSDSKAKIPVIVFTGRDSFKDRLAVLRLGAKQFLSKPATTQQIFGAIARVLPQTKSLAAKVLLVDDDIIILEQLSALLSPWGLAVTTLAEPEKFWEVLNQTKPNLVILDLEMPMANGLELCQMVRQDAQWENLPILVVTAHTDTASLRQAFAAGVDDFIPKPVLGAELVTRVISRIQGKHLSYG